MSQASTRVRHERTLVYLIRCSKRRRRGGALSLLSLTLRRPEDGVEDVLDGVVVGAEVVRVRRLRMRAHGEAAEGEGQREKGRDDGETKDGVRGSDFDAARGRFWRRWRR